MIVKEKHKIFEEAQSASKDPNRVKKILKQASEKLRSVVRDSDEFNDLNRKVQTLINMLKLHVKGEEKVFSGRTMILVVFALLYFVIPTDALPDFIPALGFTDDISVIYFVFRQIDTDLSKFTTQENLTDN